MTVPASILAVFGAAAIVAAADDALDRSVSEIGGSAPLAEIMTMRHETADIRLFVT